MEAKNLEIVVAYYHESEWAKWQDQCQDGAAFFTDSFATWKAMADILVCEKRCIGYVVQTVEIGIDEFMVWCQQNQRGTESKARAEFASYRANISVAHRMICQ